MSNSTCALTDQTCICTNAPLLEVISSCVQVECTVKEVLSIVPSSFYLDIAKDFVASQNLTTIACDSPVRDRRRFYSVLSTSLGCISWAVGLLRFLARYLSDSDFGYDDWTILLVLVGSMACILITSIKLIFLFRSLDFHRQSSIRKEVRTDNLLSNTLAFAYICYSDVQWTRKRYLDSYIREYYRPPPCECSTWLLFLYYTNNSRCSLRHRPCTL